MTMGEVEDIWKVLILMIELGIHLQVLDRELGELHQ
jgi:hypothetical protein